VRQGQLHAEDLCQLLHTEIDLFFLPIISSQVMYLERLLFTLLRTIRWKR
jgi:hypothetical protein